MGQIYRHVSPSGKSYVGLTKDTWQKRSRGGKGYKAHTKFAAAIRKYGWDNFSHEVLETFDDREELLKRESFWIAHFDSINNGYNMRDYYEGFHGFPRRSENVKAISEHAETIYTRHFKDLVSLETVAKEYEVTTETVRHLFKSNGWIPLGNEAARLRNIRNTPDRYCAVCEGQLPKDPSYRRKTCSENCMRMIRKNSTRSSNKIPWSDERKARHMEGIRNRKPRDSEEHRAATRRAAQKSGHVRGHVKKEIFNPDCTFCNENSK